MRSKRAKKKKAVKEERVKPARATEERGFQIDRGLAITVGIVGALMFVPPSIVWPLDLLRGGSVTDGAETLVIVTGVGWAGLALVVRFIWRPRLVLTFGELRENRFFLTTTIPLSAVTSIDRVEGRVDSVRPVRADTLYLFRGHPEKPWVIDLVFVGSPERFMSDLLGRCRVTYGNYTPQNAPPWARG